MTEPVYSYGTWIIGFHDGAERRRWWSVFTRPGFRHAFAFRYLQPLDAWVLVEWSPVGMFVEFWPKQNVTAMIANVSEAGGCFLEYDARGGKRRHFPLTPLYCVPLLKDLLGLRAWRVLTPWQLYCALRQRGAKPMFDLSQTRAKETGDGRSSEERKTEN